MRDLDAEGQGSLLFERFQHRVLAIIALALRELLNLQLEGGMRRLLLLIHRALRTGTVRFVHRPTIDFDVQISASLALRLIHRITLPGGVGDAA